MPTATTVVDRLCDAVNRHDLDALAACFAVEYQNETPAHPARGFLGRAQVRRNWEQLFGGIPDLSATVAERAIDGETVWTEWEMRGTRPDGHPHLMRGVVIFHVNDEEIAKARFYLEPVDVDPGGIDSEIGRVVRSADES
ncbi:MAG: nuclear transport factor 2 family protein [Acidimicrobiia bacterium]|nr:nuclear transport factor 2 family protein [Acidimicrobiia bacterium]